MLARGGAARVFHTLIAVMAAALVALSLPTLALATEEAPPEEVPTDIFNKGLGPSVEVPEWAEDEAVHFLPAEDWDAATAIAEIEEEEEEGLSYPNPPDPLLSYGGGPVQQEPHVHLILWGSNWNVGTGPQEARKALEKFYDGLSGSAFQGVLTQYFDNPGTAGGKYPEPVGDIVEFNPADDVYVDTRIAAPTELGELDVRQEVAQVRNLAGWPAGPEEQFVVIAGPGTTFDPAFESKKFCGYHQNSPSGPFAFLAYGRCNKTAEPSAITVTAAHEYAEMVTDPQPLSGWRMTFVAPSGELGFQEAADFCNWADTELLPNGVAVKPLVDNFLTNTGGGETQCVLADPDPPQLEIGDPVVSLGQPGNLRVTSEVDLAGYHGVKAAVEWQGGSGRVTGPWQVYAGTGQIQIEQEVSSQSITSARKVWIVLQLPTSLSGSRYEGRVESRGIPVEPTWKSTLCTEAAMPCPEGKRYPAGTTSSMSPDSTYYYPYLEIGGTTPTRRVVCTGGGSTWQTGAVTGAPVPLSLTSWSPAGCSLQVSGVSESNCTVDAQGLPEPGSVAWRGESDGNLRIPGSMTWHVVCAGASPPIDCSYEIGNFVGLLEAGSKAKLYLHRTIPISESEQAESGSACPGVPRTFQSHYYVDSPSPLYVSAFGELQPAVTTGSITTAGMGGGTLPALTATVNPNGFASRYQFEYVADADYAPGALNPYGKGAIVPATPSSIGGGNAPVEVSQTVEGLTPGDKYHYRVKAENDEGERFGEDRTFTVPALCVGSGGQCSFSLQSTVDPEHPQPVEYEMQDVACTGATRCLAIGNDKSLDEGFVELWNGTDWSVVKTIAGELRAISCPSSNWCMTVGKNEEGAWRVRSFESFGLGWESEAKAPPLPEGATEVRLKDISCTGESACTAVGRYYANGYKPLVARWNGTSWSLQTAPSPTEGNAGEAMLGVSCAGSTFCAAVGKANGKPFVEHWNGSSWSIVSAPTLAGATDALLQGVSCTSSTACMAVGHAIVSGRRVTLTARWNGTNWSVVSSPNPPKTGDAVLRGVSCVSANSCMAVGAFGSPQMPGAEEETTLVETWNGSQWSIQSSLTPENSKSALNSASCSSSTACTVVGTTYPGKVLTVSRTLAERWQ